MDLHAALHLAAPELILAIGVLGLTVLGALRGDKSAGSVCALSGAVLILAAFAAAFVPLGSAFNGSFVVDGVAVFAKIAIYVASAVAIVLGHGYFERDGHPRFELGLLILLAALGMSLMVSAGDLMTLYMGIELQSLSLYVLAAFRRDDPKASEAALKYFVLGALASGLLLYGSSLVYGYTGTMAFDGIAAAAAKDAGIGLIFGLVFVICGLAFKVSAAPFHMWTPDVYEGAPTPIVAFAASAPKMAAIVLFARVLLDGFGDLTDQWRQVLLIIAVLSFLVGGIGGLMQKDLKRLLAYSSIANMGYALLALSAGTDAAVQALLLFLVLYMIDTTGFFAALMSLSRDGKPITRIEELAGLKTSNPGIALAITVLSLSVLGMPPFSGFWAKYFVFGAAIQSGLWMFAAAGLVASVIAAFYYLRLIKIMWFDPSVGGTDTPPVEARGIAYVAALFSFPLAIVALTWLYPLAEQAVRGFTGH